MPEHDTKPNDRQLLIMNQWQPKLSDLAEKCSSPTATQKDADEYTHAVQKMQRECVTEQSSLNDYTQYENIIGKLGSKIEELSQNQEDTDNRAKEYEKIISEQRLQLEKVDASQKKSAEFEKIVSQLQQQVKQLNK